MIKKQKLKILSIILSFCMLLCSFPLTAFAAYENTHKNTDDPLKDFLSVAATQIGYTEGSDGYTKYGEYFGSSKMDWCCAFVAWCAIQANISKRVIPGETSCTSMKDEFSAKKLYVKSQSQGSEYTPSAGDLVFFCPSQTQTSTVSHIGIVESVKNNTITVIEGNYSNKVARTSYSVNEATIIGFATPDYDNARTGYETGRYQTTSIMNFRSSPDTSSSAICKIPSGTIVEVTDISGTWGYLTYNGESGWMSLEYSTYLPEQQHEVNWLMLDVSKWQSPSAINWEKLKENGVKAVIIRVGGRGYGSEKTLYEDEAFYEHYKNAKAAGLYVGAYFFSYALTEAQAIEEAQLTVDVLKRYECELDMPVFIDIEDYAESDGTDYQHQKAGKEVCTMVANTFCNIVEQAGYYPGIYCNKYFAEELIDADAFEDRAVWIAHYGVSQCGYTGLYDIWQYTRYGKLPGYSGYLDISYCYTDFPTLIYKINNPEPEYGEHTPSDRISQTAPTCSTTGTDIIQCVDCSITLQSITVAKTEHTNTENGILWGNTSILPGDVLSSGHLISISSANGIFSSTVENLFETQGGSKLTYCSDCKTVLSVKYYYTNDCEHASTQTSTKNPSCANIGITKHICTDCTKLVESEIIAALDHTPGDSKVTKEPSCSQYGETAVQCTECEAVLSTTYIEKLEHSFGEWKNIIELSFAEDGEDIRICSECEASETRTTKSPVYGDVNDDGQVNSADARLALRNSVKLETFTQRQTLAADIDNSGDIKSADARYILRIAVKLDNADELFEQYYPAEPKVEETTAKAEETTEKTVKTTEKSEETTVKAEETTVKAEETTVKVEETTAKTEETTVKTEETTVKTEETTVIE